MSEQEETIRGYREIGHEIIDDMMNEVDRLRAAIEDAIDTLEAMDMHIDNPLYARLRATLEPNPH